MLTSCSPRWRTTAAQVVAIVGDAFALPMVRALDAGRPGGGRYETGSLRAICSAGVAWSAHIKERLFEHIPDVVLLDACGTTEGVTYGIRQFRRGDSLSTANFDAAPGVKVLSPEGEELAPGEVGMLASPTVATGYFRDPEKTATTFFMHDGVQYAMPGDLGRIESDGTLTLIGRGVTTINTGGEKVYPGEVEEVIKALATVDDCLVVGIPDERFGQSVAALVVTKPGHALDDRRRSTPRCGLRSRGTRCPGGSGSSTRSRGSRTARSTTRPPRRWRSPGTTSDGDPRNMSRSSFFARPPVLEHRRERAPTQQHRRHDVGLEAHHQLVELGVHHQLPSARTLVDPDVAHDVATAELGQRGVGERGHRTPIGQIRRHRDGSPSLGPDLVSHVVESSLIVRRQRDVVARSCRAGPRCRHPFRDSPR